MKVLVTGGLGQVGRALIDRGRLRKGVDVVGVPRWGLDITNAFALRDRIVAEQADAVINCAAYTDVDGAEFERERAFAVNGDGAGIVAEVCTALGVPLVHVSTDYVFGGAGTRPYREDDPISPLGVYGESKAAGEAAVRAGHPAAIIVRTSWVFSRESASFVRTIARAVMSDRELRVVDDQVGCPTYADDLADALLELAVRARRGDDLDGIYHACNSGPVSWYGFALAIVAAACELRARAHSRARVIPIPTSEYATPAKRPAYSVLDTTRLAAIGIAMPPWSDGLPAAIRGDLPKAMR